MCFSDQILEKFNLDCKTIWNQDISARDPDFIKYKRSEVYIYFNII